MATGARVFLLVGSGSDDCLRRAQAELCRRGFPAEPLEPRRLVASGFSFELGGAEPHTSGTLAVGSRRLELEEIRGVLIRQPWLGNPDPSLAPDDGSYAASEMHAALAGLFHGLAVPVINRPRFDFQVGMRLTCLDHRAAFARSGLRMQGTLVTTSAEAAGRHLSDNGGHALLQDVAGRAPLVPLEWPAGEGRLRDALVAGPVRLLQRFPAVAWYILVVGARAFAERALAPSRPGPSPVGRARQEYAPTTVDPTLASRCARLTQGLGLVFAGLSVAECPDHEPVVCAVDPFPDDRWCHDEVRLGVTSALVDHLLGEGDDPRP